MKLTADQREAFERDGFLHLPGVLNTAELDVLRASADVAERRWLTASRRAGGDHKFLRMVDPIIEYGQAFVELLDHPRVFPIVRELLGDDVAIIDTSYFITPPRQGWGFTSEWHHDETLMRELPSPIPMFVKVFFPLTDVTDADGPTAVIPGSHRRPLAEDPRPVTDPRKMPGLVPLLARAGDIYLFHGRIYHAGLPNVGEHARRVLIYNYGHVWMKPWAGYEPSERLRREASTPILRQLLHAVEDPYSARLEPADAAAAEPALAPG